MNCQEVMELMQTQLDQDLEADEEHLLMSHLEHCLDCALMFERLQLLSEELTNLPKVAPPYSLVDAILPRLSEMDTQAAASDHDAVVVFPSTAKLPGAEAARKLPWTHRFGSYVSWKLAGGVVAAGLVIGMVMVGMEPSSSNNADGLLQRRQMAKTDYTMKESAASSAPSSNDAHTGVQAAPNNADSMPLNSKDQSAIKIESTASGALTSTGTPRPSAKEKATNLSGQEQQAAPTPAPTAQPQRVDQNESKAVERAAVSDSQPLTSQEIAPSSQPAASLPPKAAELNHQEGTAEDQEKNSAARADEEPDKSHADVKSGMFGIMTMPPVSPELEANEALEGQLYTALVDQRKVVIRNAKTNEVIFTSSKVWTEADTIVLLSWSEDNKLTYQVKTGERTQSFVIDLSAQTEMSVSP